MSSHRPPPEFLQRTLRSDAQVEGGWILGKWPLPSKRHMTSSAGPAFAAREGGPLNSAANRLAWTAVRTTVRQAVANNPLETIPRGHRGFLGLGETAWRSQKEWRKWVEALSCQPPRLIYTAVIPKTLIL